MASNSLKHVILPAAIIIAGFAAVVGLGGYLDRHKPELPADYGDSDLSMNGSRLKGFALGFEGLMADWYWMRSLQYVGDKIINSPDKDINIDDLRNLNPRLLYPYLDNATDLDPHFIEPYTYGAIVLPAIDPTKAIAIAEKGIANNPDEWRLYQHLGYIYWKLGEYEKAAETYEKGSEIAGAAPFMKLTAAAMRTEGGSRSTARRIFKQMLEGTADEQVKITAERRLKELDWLDQREAIDKVLGEFKERNARCAANLSEILPMLTKISLSDGNAFMIDNSNRLVDPTGTPYILDRDNCRVTLDREHTALPR